MFSQYSWGDFIKFVLALAIPYYAYVLIRYYREDIREWWNNRNGQQPQSATAQPVAEEEDATLFAVNDYSRSADEWPSAPAPEKSQETTGASATSSEYNGQQEHDEPRLDGPPVGEKEEFVAGIPLVGHLVNGVEQSLDELIGAAGRITTDEQGRVAAAEDNDSAAARLAAVINNQRAQAAFADISFSR